MAAPVRQRAVLWVLSSGIVAALCIPAVYLVWRASDVPAEAWELFLSSRTLGLMGQTLLLAALVTLFGAGLALPLAWLTTSTRLPGRHVWTALLCLPLAVPSFVSGYVLLAAFGDGGLFDSWGLPRPTVYGLGGSTFALTLSTYPYLFLTFRAALLRQDPSLLEAAMSLGYPPGQAFWRVTVPQLFVALRSGSLLVAFYVLSDFGAVGLLQYDTFSRAVYVQLEGAFDRSLASLWSLGLMGIAIAVLTLAWLGPKEAPMARTGLGVQRRALRIALGRWTAAALALCTVTVTVGVGLPLGVTSVWLARGASVGASGLSVATALVEPMLNSAFVSLLAAVAAALFMLPLAALLAREHRDSRAARWLERAAYASYCLPPVVVALSLISFGIRTAPLLYGTLAMLVFAHVVRFAPQALGASKNAFQQLPRSVAEAARSLGHPPASVAWKVVFPLVRPGVVAGAALVFLTTMKELPATLLLGPIGFSTLATRVWSATAEGHFADGAPPALVLMAISSLSVAWLLRKEDVRSAGATG